MSKWPEIPLVTALGEMLAKKDNEKLEGRVRGAVTAAPMTVSKEKVLEALKSLPEIDFPCICNATVICSEATEESKPVHIKVDEGTVHLAGLRELNKTDIQLEENFLGCKKSESDSCYIIENYSEWIWGNEWQGVDESSAQGPGREKLSVEKSFMVCTEYGGMIYFYNDGQEVRPFIDGTQICYLSDEYLEWLKMAEGLKLYPYRDTADKNDAQAVHNVTMGIGFTFDDTGRNWDILREVLGWTDEQIKEVIAGVYAGIDYSNSNYVITEEQAYEILDRTIPYYMDILNQAASLFYEENQIVSYYMQNEWEAMFDAVYNGGTGTKKKEGTDNEDDPFGQIKNEDYILYHYFRRDRVGAAKVIDKYGGGGRRRLNQIEIFFSNTYDMLEKERFNEIRRKYGISERPDA